MKTESLNRDILNLPESHPAHRFLRAFLECHRDCVGIEASNEPVDQKWYSERDAREWLYSDFAYQYLAFEIVLDGWLTHATQRTANEKYWLAQIPRWRDLMVECRAAAEANSNVALFPVIAQVLRMLALWEDCILKRDTATDDDNPRQTDCGV